HHRHLKSTFRAWLGPGSDLEIGAVSVGLGSRVETRMTPDVRTGELPVNGKIFCLFPALVKQAAAMVLRPP
ncbi:Hypothetical predicted protein, partial [Pelobates cultripes]